MSNITPFLWFDNDAEDAANFYVSVFKNSRITDIRRYGDAGPGPKGCVMTVAFELDGNEFTALNGGPQEGFHFTPAMSLMVTCKTQDEVDYFWEKLTAGGKEIQCGWLTDKFGITWQIVPEGIADFVAGDDEDGAERAMQAMFQMKKLDINVLRRAYAGETAAR